MTRPGHRVKIVPALALLALTPVTASARNVSSASKCQVAFTGTALRAPASASSCQSTAKPAPSAGSGIHKIKHVVIIMQENRSFDSYFGTYPGVDGIPRDSHGRFTVCVPDPMKGGCQEPYHNPSDVNAGGPHMAVDATADINGGKMNGFIGSVESGRLDTDQLGCQAQGLPSNCVDVMGYHDQRELANYWSYARHFVLEDHMFEPNLGWSLPAHLYMVSAWSAARSVANDPMSCQSNLVFPDTEGVMGAGIGNQGAAALTGLLTRSDPDDAENATQPPDYAWTDITYLLHRYNVSWRYYLSQGSEPDCASGAMTCTPVPQNVKTPEIWNPLPDFTTADFTTVYQDNQIGNIRAAPREHWVLPAARRK